MKSDADRILKQQEASRQFFEQFTEKMTQKENKLKEKLHESWKNPQYRTRSLKNKQAVLAGLNLKSFQGSS